MFGQGPYFVLSETDRVFKCFSLRWRLQLELQWEFKDPALLIQVPSTRFPRFQIKYFELQHASTIIVFKFKEQ